MAKWDLSLGCKYGSTYTNQEGSNKLEQCVRCPQDHSQFDDLLGGLRGLSI